MGENWEEVINLALRVAVHSIAEKIRKNKGEW